MGKNLQIALGVLVILLAIYLLNQNRQKQYTAIEVPALNLDVNNIFSFTITNPTDSITISRADTTWEIFGNDTLNIKQRSIDTFLDKVITVKKGTLISKNKDKWGIYSVHDTNSTHLYLFDKDSNLLNNFYVGQSKSNYANSYIRMENDDNVYLTTENISYYLRATSNYWGEKPIEEVPIDTTSSR
tara:strand:- start:106 stop:663 length:558 start_codon:yes stop_codon:yes gene_type:complete